MVIVALLEEARVVEGVYLEVNQIQMEKNTQIKKGAHTQNYKLANLAIGGRNLRNKRLFQ
jgi:hypothetical protein